MAIRDFLTATLGYKHVFMMNDLVRDPGSTGIVTTATLSTGSFVAQPLCEGVDNSYEAISGADGGDAGFVVNNTNDINSNGDMWRRYDIGIWFEAIEIDVPTCIYEQGGGTNNHALLYGLGGVITTQAADAGTPFLIAQANFVLEAARPLFVYHIWQHPSNSGEATNRIRTLVNGVFQNEAVSPTSSAVFPAHGGNATAGNTADALRTYNSSTINLASRAKRTNMLLLGGDLAISDLQIREIFERTVLPQVTIAADTVANQQAALDALIGNAYVGVNCAIRIIQATDATNYRLFVDNINFTEDANLRDIAIQYVGPNTLTLENANGSNVVEVSTPAEVDQSVDGTSILPGGGSIALVQDTVRVNSVANQTNITATKIVIEQPGTYVFTNVNVSELENVSGGTIDVQSNVGIPTVTDTGAGSVTNLLDSAFTFDAVDSWTIYATAADRDTDANAIDNGISTDTYAFQFIASTTYYFRVVKGGVVFLLENTPAASGETQISLSTEALLATVAADVWAQAPVDNTEPDTMGELLKQAKDNAALGAALSA